MIVTASKDVRISHATSRTARWYLEKVLVPITVALLSTAAFSEIMLNYVSLLFAPPNWIGTTYQPNTSMSDLKQYFDNWTMQGESGRVNARIRPEDDNNKDYWLANGFERNGRRTLAYVAEKDSNMGVGLFYLERVNNKQEYRGRQIFFDCTVKKILSCPYILVPSGGREILKQPEYLAYLKQGCSEAIDTAQQMSCPKPPP